MKIKMSFVAVLATVIALGWMVPAEAAPPTACVIDFEGLDAGTIVTELSSGDGISGCSISGIVAVTSQNTLFSSEAAIIFDSDCPVIPDPFSEDLTPHSSARRGRR